MENEELAALRASLLAAQRQPAQVKLRQARLSERLAGGDELVPYVLAPSCSDPRDRIARDDARDLRVVERGLASRFSRDADASPRYEPSPFRPGIIATALLASALLVIALHTLYQALLLH